MESDNQKEFGYDPRIGHMIQRYGMRPRPLTIVDVGSRIGSTAGTAFNTLSPDKLILVDPDSEALRQAEINIEDWKTEYQVDSATELQYKVGFAEELADIVGKSQADLVVGRRVVRYIAKEKRPVAFSNIYSALVRKGVFLFDVPVKRPEDWISEEDFALSPVAAVLEKQYGVEGIGEVTESDHNPPSVVSQIYRELQETGFSEIRTTYLNSMFSFQDFINDANRTVDMIISAAIKDQPTLEKELSQNSANIHSAVEAYMPTVLVNAPPTLGLTMIEAIK